MSLALFSDKPGRHLHLQPQRAFVQIGQEIAADRGAEADHRQQREDHDAIDDARLLEAGAPARRSYRTVRRSSQRL